jgi:MFS family permease
LGWDQEREQWYEADTIHLDRIDQFTLLDDTTPVEWVGKRMHESSHGALLWVPDGFESYARVFFPYQFHELPEGYYADPLSKQKDVKNWTGWEGAGYSKSQSATLFALVGPALIAGGFVFGQLSRRIGGRVALPIAYLVLTFSAVQFSAFAFGAYTYMAAIAIGLAGSGIPIVTAYVVRVGVDDLYGAGMSSMLVVLGGITVCYAAGGVMGPLIGWNLLSPGSATTSIFVLAAIAGGVGATLAGLQRRTHEPLTGE